MSNLKLAVAVMDIGTTGVRILVGRITEKGTPKIIAKSECISAEPINVLAPDLSETNLRACVEKAVDTILTKTGIEITSAYVSLSNAYIRQIYSSGEIFLVPQAPVTGLDVGKVLNRASEVDYGEDEVLVDIVPLAYFADGDLLKDKPEGTVCSRLSLEANAVIAKGDVCANITKLLADCGIKTDGFVPSFFASQKVFDSSSFFSSKGGSCFTVIADVGGTSTDISIYYNGIPFAFDSLKVGGNNVTRDIEVVLSVPTNQAERLKMEYNYASPLQVSGNESISLDRADADAEQSVEVSYLAGIINARIEDIATRVAKKAGELMEIRGVRKSLINRFYFIGDGIVQYRGLKEVLESVIRNADVEAVDKGKDLGIKTSFTTSLGMLIYISSKIKYGRRPSTVINHNEADPKKTEGASGEDETFGEKLKRSFAKFGDSIKDFFGKAKG
ncbi:MAG: hypothetical protein J6112_07965 [Clostridia bacterium]|nr:hypothetical protein [Clostridia bacterium]MCR5694124.1 hypothetical protein [Clostridia bacterium]